MIILFILLLLIGCDSHPVTAHENDDLGLAVVGEVAEYSCKDYNQFGETVIQCGIEWIPFKRKDVIDKVSRHIKIRTEKTGYDHGHYSTEVQTKWYKKEHVIMYEGIDPFNIALKRIKKRKESVLREETK